MHAVLQLCIHLGGLIKRKSSKADDDDADQLRDFKSIKSNNVSHLQFQYKS